MPRFVIVSIALIALLAAVGCSAGDAPTKGRGAGGSPEGGGGGTAGYNPYGGTGGNSYGGGNPDGGSGGYNAYGGAPGTGGTSATWTNVTGNLSGMASECGNLGFVSAKPDVDMLIAGVAKKGLWSSTDGGATWTALGTGAGSAVITNRPAMVLYDPTTPSTFWEAGIYNGGGVYVTTDNGATFQALGNVTHNDTVSVDFTDPARKTLLAGSHEGAQKVFRSTDGGATWTNVGANLPAGTSFSSTVQVVDANTHLVGVSGWGSGTYGVFRTTDGGTTWASASTEGAAAAPLLAKDGAIYFEIIWDNGVLKSVDKGVSWTKPVGYKVLSTNHLIELPDARLAGIGFELDIKVSADGGKTWKSVSTPWRWTPGSLTYSAQRKAFYASHNDCNGTVPTDAIASVAWDYTAK